MKVKSLLKLDKSRTECMKTIQTATENVGNANTYYAVFWITNYNGYNMEMTKVV